MVIRALCAGLFVALAVSSFSCYRATGIPRNQVSAFQATAENTEVLPSGQDSTNRIGDFILQSGNLQLILDGDLNSSNRQLFGVPCGGGIIDASTRYVDVFSRLQTRADDGINLITQGVNLNPGTPVRYVQIEVDEVDEVTADIILTGYIYDIDGSLRAAGAEVDSASGRVLDCTVTTRLALIDSVDQEIEITDADGNISTVTTSNPIYYVTITTIVQNRSVANLPVFTVHDHVITTPAATDVFLPFPEFGFSREKGESGVSEIAYPPYVTLQARQDDTAQYMWTSQMDALMSAAIVGDPARELEHTMIGKVGKPGEYIPPGGEMSFIREFFVFSNSRTPEHLFDIMANMLVESESPLNIFQTTGEFRAAFTYGSAPGGQLEVHYIGGAHIVYDGSAFQPVTSDKAFPIYGDRILDPYISLIVPLGQLGLSVDIANMSGEMREVAVSEITNEDGDEVFFERPMIVEEDEIFDFGLATMAEDHYASQIAVIGNNERQLRGRIRVRPQGGEGTVVIGTKPELRQGDVAYITGTSASFHVPNNKYDVYLSHGPLYNVNVFEIDVVDSIDEDGATTTFVTPGTVQAYMEPALDWPGYLSADFGVRSANDYSGMVPKDDLLLFGLAEDLDVVFFSDVGSQPKIETTFDAMAALQGAYDDEDQDNNVDSLKDELTVSRCAATIGTATTGLPFGRGKFSMLNLPHEEQSPYLELPLIETDPAEFYDLVRQLGDQVLIHVMRPRAPLESRIGLFSAIASYSGLQQGESLRGDNAYLNRGAENGSATRWSDFDLLQVLPGNLYDEYLLARADWFSLLNDGVFKPATGGSTAGETKDLPIGVVRTWVRVSDTTLRDNDLSEFWTNVAAGNMFVSNGPLMEASVGTASMGETAAVGTEFNLRVRILAAPWIPVPELRVVLDGEVVQTLPLANEAVSETVRIDRDIAVSIDESGSHWLVVEAGVALDQLAAPQHARSVGTYGIVNPGHLPLAFTNPIFLNVSGR